MKKTTIYDIAEASGFSPSTVSRVINGKPGVKPSTKEIIEHYLSQNDYSLDVIAQGLATKSTKLIGVLVADIRNIHHTNCAYYIERELSSQGYYCIILNTGFIPEDMAKSVQRMSQRRVDGLVLIGSAFQNQEVKNAIRQYLSDVPVMMTNGYLDLSNVCSVLADESNGAYECVNFLVKKGRRHICFVQHANTAANISKVEGYKHGIATFLPDASPLVYHTQSSIGDAYATTKRLMAEHPETDAIIYGVDFLAASGVRALIDLNIAIPKEVAIIGFNNSVYSELCRPKLTALDSRLNDISRLSAKNLIDALNGHPPVKKLLVFSSIVERETT